MIAKQLLIDFREKLSQFFTKRKDAIFELMDANTSSNKTADSITQLSNSEFFTRQYPSITDAVANGLKVAEWGKIQTHAWNSSKTNDNVTYHRFVMDCTPRERQFSKKVEDRSIVYKPNPSPGNKPICAGHQYSAITYIPPGSSEERKRWVVPLSTERVPSQQKGTIFGMTQLASMLKNLDLESDFTVSIGDSAYSSAACHDQASTFNNHIHIARMRSNRTVYELLEDCPKTKGARKIYGKKMQLNDPDTFLSHDEQAIIPIKSKKGLQFSLKVKGWNTVSFRGTRKFKAHQKPFRLIQAVLLNEQNEPVFKRPLWIAVFGERRLELSIHECVNNYYDRYDIEHYFRFGKQRLLMGSFQTPDVVHEENWWRLCALSYTQLYLSRTFSHAMPEAWERYLPEFKNQDKHTIASPSFAQRGFSKVLKDIGTPAKKPVQRGRPIGRKLGKKQKERVEHPVIFKQSKKKTKQKDPVSGFEIKANNSKPKNKDDVLVKLNDMLKDIDLSMEKFCQFAINPT